MSKSIGGFLDLEIRDTGKSYHPDAIALSNGRACLNALLKSIKPEKVYVPFYTCDALLEPIKINKIHFEFYPIDENFCIKNEINLCEHEFIININYFGLKSNYIRELENKYKERLINDNTMSFFDKEYKHSLSFNSCRKFFGVPDGGYLYQKSNEIGIPTQELTEFKYDHLISRMLGKDKIYYNQFLENERLLSSKICKMSNFSKRILSNIDYEEVGKKRIENFDIFNSKLSQLNKLKLTLSENQIPHYYPFLPIKDLDKKILISKKIYIPTLWPDISKRARKGFEYEIYLSDHILPLPIDQRYNTDEMLFIIDAIQEQINE